MEQTTSTPPQDDLKFDPKDIEANKGITVLSYLGILCLIPLLSKKDSKFAQAHSKQGLALFLTAILAGVLAGIPIIGWIGGPILALLILVVMVMGIVNVLQGKFWKIPALYDLSKKLNF